MGLFKLKIACVMAVTLATLTLGLVAADGPKVPADKPAVPKAVAAVAEKPAAVEGDLAAMQGLWETVQPGFPFGVALVRGKVLWIVGADQRYASRFELRTTAGRNPKWINLVTDGCTDVVSEQVPGAVMPCIYQLTNDDLVIAMSSAGKFQFRPAEFVNDDHVKTMQFRRPKLGTSPGAERVDARNALVGHWTVTRQAYPHDDRSAMVDRPVGVVEITPEFLFVQRPASDKKFVWEAAAYTLDWTRDPKWIDLVFLGKAEQYGFGVYESAGDTLRISYRLAVPRVFRTLEFKSGIEEALTPDAVKPACALLELKRVKTP